MAAVSLFILLALFHPAFSFPCRPFPCGELGEIFFPFTNIETDERCGPFVADGCKEEIKKVQLGRGSQKWYQIESIFQDPFHYPHWSEISITDIELQSKLNSRKCESFQNLSLPSLPYTNFKITSKLTTLHKCNSSKDYPKTQFHYNNYSKCPNFKIYYARKHNANLLQSPPLECPIVKLPLNKNNSHDDVFQMLTANFSLHVRIRPDCYKCQLHGGKCRNNNGGFNCTGANEYRNIPFPALPTSLEGHKGKCRHISLTLK
ncbi:LEAF RUST 10 DISEASE-RESISTANCE LOCUS RECEPTOR-LIKE PROTEIN KINASE-like 1.1 [Hevea brasiliensis]|uniref:LEAF RUST 10 DISEASE-RESISTANCE LOCUS RECEPTOR-LIKE PROTEIN KINASE-like 1.1 n=1 Tax=Hevea brasiliensis TaxID=3981 RepID=UPI0025FCD919|nr:LEAF RUST 10 DISEASE-RESISTANCE LOCUS RECEPTOR-LIKE PROTEIN KINASE-like 1.1 [Hevea brasiliensis]